MPAGFQFNPPPGWPPPEPGWEPDDGWIPDPSWPPAPIDWLFWIPKVTSDISSSNQREPQADPVGSTDSNAQPDISLSAPNTEENASATVESLIPDPLIAIATDTSTQTTDAASGDFQPHHPSNQDPLNADPVIDQTLFDLNMLITDRRRELEQLEANIKQHRAELLRTEAIAAESAQIESQLVELNDALLLQQVGIFQYHHPLENAEAYRDKLKDLNERIHQVIRDGKAILASDRFAYNNSLAQGHKMTSDFSKLMLRAYNAESDACVRSLRAGTSTASIKRLETAAETIAKRGKMMEMRVSDDYHGLRVEEINLTSDYLMKVQEEKETAREERERLREERKVEAELAAERELLNKERAHYANSLSALLAQGKHEEAADLHVRLAEIDEAIAQNDYRAANIRAGYVYVISNVGAFGPHMVKIGLTRRLEPMDRIRELGDASVPFPFDVHAIYFSDDAVTLENQLHEEFSTRRVNHVNLRREHFFATPEEVRQALAARVGNLLEFTEQPEATQYNMSRAQWPDTQELSMSKSG